MIRSLLLFLFLSVFYACNSNKSKRIKIDGEIVKGNISKDTIYNGLIKFYDSNNVLLREAWYINDTIHGEVKTYYPNGKIESKYTMDRGKLLGDEFIYDSTGEMISSQCYYYDLVAGPLVYYKNGQPVIYKFYSLDSYQLFKIQYDSIKGKPAQDWNKELFYVTFNYAGAVPHKEDVVHSFFIYTLNPPGYDFKYSLCVIDSADNIIKKIEEVGPRKIWAIVEVNEKEKEKDQFFAFTVDVFQNDTSMATILSSERYQ